MIGRHDSKALSKSIDSEGSIRDLFASQKPYLPRFLKKEDAQKTHLENTAPTISLQAPWAHVGPVQLVPVTNRLWCSLAVVYTASLKPELQSVHARVLWLEKSEEVYLLRTCSVTLGLHRCRSDCEH